MSLQSKLDYALKYAELGWAVLPLHWITADGRCSCGEECKSPGKHPKIGGGLTNASNDKSQIAIWWRYWSDANIGIATGAVSGLFVLDIDVGKGGDASFEALETQYGKIPDDVMAITGSGGRHYVMRYDGTDCRSTTNLLPGIDTRGDGGYIVVEPSNHISGNVYEWEGSSDPLNGAIPAIPPTWLLQLLRDKRDKPAAASTEKLLSPADVRKIRAAFSYIPADDRDTWVRLGGALHSESDSDQVFGLWCEWSQQSAKFELKDQRRVWVSFKCSGIDTVAAVLHMAKEFGYVPAADRPPEPPPYAEVPDDVQSSRRSIVKVKTRSDFETEIAAAGSNFDALVCLADEIQAAALHPAEIAILLKDIAKQTGAPVGALRSKRGGDNYPPQRPENFPFLRELNEKHAVVPVGGRVLIMNREYDPALKRPLLTFSTAEDFRLRYQNKTVFAKGEQDSIANVWLGHPARRQYEGIVFAPGETIDGYYNLFQGFAVTPKAGSCDKFIEFLSQVICGGDSELFSYLWGWLAHLFQKPNELPETAIILRGRQGTGKNTFVDTIGALVGNAHFLQLSNIMQVTGRFSGHLADVLLVFANEAIWGGDKTAEGTLKHIISDGITFIERKRQDGVPMANYKRLIAASNEDWVVPRGLDDRRMVIIDVSDKHKEDHAYFAEVRVELKAGGYAALMHELMQTDLSSFEPRRVPKHIKQSGWELKIRSGGTVLEWWFSMLDQGWFRLEDSYGDSNESVPLWAKELPCADLHSNYLKWCEGHRKMHPETDVVMGRKIKEWGVGKIRSRRHNRVTHYVIPPLEEARAIFSRLCSIPDEVWADD